MDDMSENRQRQGSSSKFDTIKRMMSAYKKRKRKEKIEKLMSKDNHWKGLS
jgi:hypothetical protein